MDPGGTRKRRGLIPSEIMPILTVTCEETGLSQRFLIRKDRFTVGRSKSTDVPIADDSVSKVHIAIARSGAGYAFQDLWSRNGTLLNGRKCAEGLLKDGDCLRIGRIGILFQAGEDSPDPTAAAGRTGQCEGAAAQGAPVEAITAQASPLAAPDAPAAPPAARGAKVHGELRKEIEFIRLMEKHKRIVIALEIGVLGISLGFLAGRFDLRPVPRGTGSGAAPVAAPASGGAEARLPASAAPDAVPGQAMPAESAGMEPSGGQTDPEAVERLCGTLLAGPDRPYADGEESHCVLFRLFFDVLDRPPTRAEETAFIPLDHRERWRRLQALAAPAAPAGTAGLEKALEAAQPPDPTAAKSPRLETLKTMGTFRRFLGRAPTALDGRAIEAAQARATAGAGGGDEAARGASDLGLLLTASAEYRSKNFLRDKSLRQSAASLIVDFLDRPPSDGEVPDMVRALEEFPGSSAVARILAWSSAAPATGPNEASANPRAWARSEILRFLPVPLSEEEMTKTVEAVPSGPEGVRWLRLALAGLPEYRRY